MCVEKLAIIHIYYSVKYVNEISLTTGIQKTIFAAVSSAFKCQKSPFCSLPCSTIAESGLQ